MLSVPWLHLDVAASPHARHTGQTGSVAPVPLQGCWEPRLPLCPVSSELGVGGISQPEDLRAWVLRAPCSGIL